MDIDGQLDELHDLLTPPHNPTCADGDWTEAEHRYGIRFPDDFKLYIKTYGSGIIQPLGLWVMNPFRADIPVGMILEQHERQIGADFPYPLRASAQSLFPWGASNSNHYLFWTVENRVVKPEIVATLDCCEWRAFDGHTLIGFLMFLLRSLSSSNLDPLFDPLQTGDDIEFTFEQFPPAT